MKKLSVILSLALILCLMVGCQRSEEVAEEPAVDVEVDKEAIRGLLDDFYEAHYAGDIDTLVSFYTEDAMRIAPDMPLQVGKEAIKKYFEREMKQYDMQVNDDFDYVDDDRVEEVLVSGDLGMARGADIITATPKEGGESSKSIVRWVAIYERQADGTWKIVCEIWNDYKPLLEEQD